MPLPRLTDKSVNRLSGFPARRFVSMPAAPRAAETVSMCGIAGWYRRGGRPVPESAIAAQCARDLPPRPRRGRRACSTAISASACAASASRTSPTATSRWRRPDGRFVLVFNGEIYNHLDAAAGAGGGGLALRDPLRHGDRARRLRRLGPRRLAEARRHVCRGALGPARAAPDPRPRSARHQAALPLASRMAASPSPRS